VGFFQRTNLAATLPDSINTNMPDPDSLLEKKLGSEISADLIDDGFLTIDEDSSFEKHHHNDEKVNVDGKFVVSWKYN
jgi:hypothetical protein